MLSGLVAFQVAVTALTTVPSPDASWNLVISKAWWFLVGLICSHLIISPFWLLWMLMSQVLTLLVSLILPYFVAEKLRFWNYCWLRSRISAWGRFQKSPFLDAKLDSVSIRFGEPLPPCLMVWSFSFLGTEYNLQQPQYCSSSTLRYAWMFLCHRITAIMFGN